MNKLFIFALGAATGSLVTWKILEKKYKIIADEEIESVREHYREKLNKLSDSEEMDEVEDEYLVDDIPDFTEEEKEEYQQIVNEYTDDATVQLEPAIEHIAPYVIAPEEFGEGYGYDTKSWTCYADNVITDENGQIVGNPECVIGDALQHFGEYEDDSVYVRNEDTECDYEILKHYKTFSEVNKEDN